MSADLSGRLMDDLADRLAAVDGDEAFALWGMFSRLADDRAMTVPVRALMDALAQALTFEHHRRITGEAYRLDAVVEAVRRLTDADLREGAATHAEVREEGKGRVPERMLAVHETIGQMLLTERLERAALARRLDREVGHIDVGWGWDPRRDVEDTPDDDSPAGSVCGEA